MSQYQLYDENNQYSLPVSATFDYDEFTRLLNDVQFPVMSVVGIDDSGIIFDDTYLLLEDIKHNVSSIKHLWSLSELQNQKRLPAQYTRKPGVAMRRRVILA